MRTSPISKTASPQKVSCDTAPTGVLTSPANKPLGFLPVNGRTLPTASHREELGSGVQCFYLRRLVLCTCPVTFFSEELLPIFNHPTLLIMFHTLLSSSL